MQTEEIIRHITEEIVKCLSDNLEALILVGSFSRSEGIEGLSDIEFWAVVHNLSKAKKPKLDNNVSLGFTTRRHLKMLKPYIYTVEVKRFGKVLYGDSNILDLIPNYSYGDIEPFDGFILLNNRIVEQLILLNKIEDGQKIGQYDFDKSYIQLVNSLLVFNRKYRGLYPEKLDEFRKVYRDKDMGLLNKAEEALASIKNTSGVAITKDEALKKWQEVREYYRKVWIEEKKVFSGIGLLLKILSIGKPLQFCIYQKASKLYFSDKYQDRRNRNTVIKKWERFVK